jgi:hypothetical protein
MEPLQKSGPCRIGHSHLRAGMKRDFRNQTAGRGGSPQILHDQPVHGQGTEKKKILFQLLHFMVSYENIHRDIDGYPIEMTQADGFPHCFLCKIIRIPAGAERRAAQIYGIGAALNGGSDMAHCPCRRQQFHDFPPVQAFCGPVNKKGDIHFI